MTCDTAMSRLIHRGSLRFVTIFLDVADTDKMTNMWKLVMAMGRRNIIYLSVVFFFSLAFMKYMENKRETLT